MAHLNKWARAWGVEGQYGGVRTGIILSPDLVNSYENPEYHSRKNWNPNYRTLPPVKCTNCTPNSRGFDRVMEMRIDQSHEEWPENEWRGPLRQSTRPPAPVDMRGMAVGTTPLQQPAYRR